MKKFIAALIGAMLFFALYYIGGYTHEWNIVAYIVLTAVFTGIFFAILLPDYHNKKEMFVYAIQIIVFFSSLYLLWCTKILYEIQSTVIIVLIFLGISISFSILTRFIDSETKTFPFSFRWMKKGDSFPIPCRFALHAILISAFAVSLALEGAEPLKPQRFWFLILSLTSLPGVGIMIYFWGLNEANFPPNEEADKQTNIEVKQ